MVYLKSSVLFQKILEFALLVKSLEVGVSTNMLSAKENVGDSLLRREFVKRVLNFATVRNFVQFNNVDVNDIKRAKQSLRLLAVWAVRFGGYKDSIRVDELFGFSDAFRGWRHCRWVYLGF